MVQLQVYVFSCSALRVHDALKTVLSFIVQNGYFYFISFLKGSSKTQRIEGIAKMKLLPVLWSEMRSKFCGHMSINVET